MIKLEHMILHLKQITLQNNYKFKLLILQIKNSLCLHNPETQKIKNKPAYINTVIEQTTPSQRDDEDKRDACARSKSPQDLLYSTFVLIPMTERSDMIQDIEVEVHHEISITTKTKIHTQEIVLHLENDLVMRKIPLLHDTHDHDMPTIKEIQDLTDHLTDLLIDLLIDVTLVPDIDHAHIQETTDTSSNIR